MRCGPSSKMELSRSSSRMIALFAVRAFVTVRPDTERFTVGVSLGLAPSLQPTGSAIAKSNAWRTLDVRGTFTILNQNLILSELMILKAALVEVVVRAARISVSCDGAAILV